MGRFPSKNELSDAKFNFLSFYRVLKMLFFFKMETNVPVVDQNSRFILRLSIS